MIVKSASFGDMGNNCYLIVDEKTNKSALVDCTEYSKKMLDFIGETELEYILLTHGHFDHIIGTKEVKEKYNCKVAISSPDKEMLQSARHSLAMFCNAPQNNVAPDIILNDGDIIKLGETEIKVISTPGHTPGSVCFIAENYIFSGDTLFCCSCGRTDFPGGSVEEMIFSLRRLANLEGDYKVLPGHEEETTLEFERKHNPYMK